MSKGEFRVRDSVIEGDFEIDMRSIKNVDLEGDDLQPVLIEHLKSDDFFFVKLFPKAVVVIESGKLIGDAPMGAANYDIQGSLSLRGVSADIRFPATIGRTSDGAISVEAHFDLDRTRWNVIYGSGRFFEHLGMHLVYDAVSIELRVLSH
ncbi:MAG: YceI family protein [Deltaproteobacteria bacterium]|nr:YceI family protein [Deltaproteobacteria bacterium]